VRQQNPGQMVVAGNAREQRFDRAGIDDVAAMVLRATPKRPARSGLVAPRAQSSRARLAYSGLSRVWRPGPDMAGAPEERLGAYLSISLDIVKYYLESLKVVDRIFGRHGDRKLPF
jgi:hypothetical protein